MADPISLEPKYPDVGLVVVAAGRGERAGQGSGPKQYRMLGARSIIAHTLDCFSGTIAPSNTVIVIHREDHALLSASVAHVDQRYIVIEGGQTRQASVCNGLNALAKQNVECVLIHDAARPFVKQALIEQLVDAARISDAAIPVQPIAETVKRLANNNTILESVPRHDLGLAQTPQAFRYDKIMALHTKAAESDHSDFTDDASLFEWVGHPVTTVPGDPENLKITYPEDFTKAYRIMEHDHHPAHKIPDIRAGHGYDVHVFGDGDHVTLCGLDIPHSRRLSGHSDADVCLHALTDALLATCGQGDIGDHFPPSDMQWKGAASHIFLTEAVRIVRANGGTILNADVTIIAEEPKIGPHKQAMRNRLGELLGIAPTRCSVKATTNEKVGFIGRGEGIAAIATSSVYYGEMETPDE